MMNNNPRQICSIFIENVRQRFQQFWAASEHVVSREQMPAVDVATLEDRILFSAVPLPIDLVDVIENEIPEGLDSIDSPDSWDGLSDDRSEFEFVFSDEDGNVELPDALEGRDGELIADKGLDQTVQIYSDLDVEQDVSRDVGDVAVLRRELVFVDTSVGNYEQLVDDLRSNTDLGRELEVVLISGQEDGIQRVSHSLERRSDLSSIHVVTHGSARGIRLGSTWLTHISLDGYASEISGWGDALTRDGDLLFYGCNLAGSESGESLMEQLQTLTNADVAASTDRTGARILDGNWELEYERGIIETEIAFSESIWNEWIGILGPDGIIVTESPGFSSQTTDMALQSDNKAIVVTSSGGVFRYDVDGSIDTTFGGDGHVDLGLYSAKSIVVQNDGKILVAGLDASVQDFGIVRLNVDGSLDSTFSGDGIATADFGYQDSAQDLAVQDDGKIVVVGYSVTSTSEVLVARFNADGSLDTTFSGDGREIMAFGAGSSRASGVEVQTDGKLAIAGYSNLGSGIDMLLVRLNSDGSLDTTFRGSGYAIDDLGGGGNDNGYDLVIQDDGKIVVGAGAIIGNGSFQHTLIRYNVDGSLDSTFSGDGIANRQLTAGTNLTLGIDLQSDGRLVTTGYSTQGSDTYFTVLRFNSDGSADSSFGTDGSFYTKINNINARGAGIAVQSDGKILAAGRTHSYPSDIVFMRLTTSGELDSTFVPGYNFAPEITSDGGGATGSVSVAENTTSVTTVTSTDANADMLAYSIIGGADSSKFTINSATGALSFVSGPNYENTSDSDGDNVYDVTVQVSDGNGGTDMQDISVAVTDANEFNVTAPTDTDNGTNWTFENSFGGYVNNLTVTASDADGDNNSVSFYLTDDAGGRFDIDSTGRVMVVGNLDAESAQSHNIAVRAVSDDGSTADTTFTIEVTDTDEYDVTTPSDIDGGTNAVSENAANGTSVGLTASASDADIGNNTVSYSLTNSADGRFSINGSTGVVTVANSTLLDFETNTSHSITVLATSSDGSSASQQFTITVSDFNEAPTLNNNSLAVSEGATVVISSSMLTATDAEGSNLTFVLTNIQGGHFGLASSPQSSITSFSQDQIDNGQIVFVHHGGESAPSYDVSVTDGNTATAPAAVAISFTNVNDAPMIVGLEGSSVSAPNDGTAVLIDPNHLAGLQDRDSPTDYDGAVLTALGTSFAGLDTLGIDTSGPISLTSGFSDGSILSVNGTSCATLSGTSSTGITITFHANATASDVETVLQSFTFASTSNTFGQRSVEFAFNDNDGVAHGGVEISSTVTTHIHVSSAADGKITTSEDTFYTFVATDFDFSGFTGSDLANITVARLPSDGTLTLDGVPVTTFQAISKADIDAGKLKFIPGTNDNGASYASFDFVADDGNSSVSLLGGEFSYHTIGGSAMTSASALLGNSDNFGNGGTHSTRISVVGSTNSIDSTYLSMGQVLFDGHVVDSNWTSSELSALDTWVQSGGILISANDNTLTDGVSSYFGLTIGGNASSTWLVNDSNSRIMNGPFGLVGNDGDSFQGQGSISFFESASLAVGDQVLAVDSLTGEPTLVLRTVGSGAILFTGDEGIFRVGMSNDGSISTANDRLVANIFAWAADAATDSTTFTINIDVDAINDDPTNDGGFPTEISTIEDSASNVDLSAIDLHDADSASGVLTVELSAGSGTLSSTSGGGITIGGSGSQLLSLTGTQTDLNAFLDDPSNIQYTGSSNSNGENVDTITARVTDHGNVGAGGGTYVMLGTVNVDIDAVNDSPAIATNTGTTVSEGAAGTIITTATLNEGDVDDAGAGLTYSITDATDNGTLYLSGAALDVHDTFTQADIDAGLVTYDHDGSESTIDTFSFLLADGGENGVFAASGTFTISITPVNDNSTTAITDSNATADFVNENASVGTAVGITAFANDADAGDVVSYSLDRNDGGRFAINGATGEVSVAGSLDREIIGATVSITVRATSIDTSFQTRVFTINIGDVDESDVSAVSDTNGATNFVAENAVYGTTVGITASALDADSTATVSYSLTNNAGGRFAIDNSTGVVTVADGSLLDRETLASHGITIRATSSDGSTSYANFTITVGDVDESDVSAISDTDGSANAVSENAANGTAVGVTASATDADSTDSVIYSLTNDAGGRFTIDGVFGVVTVADGSLLDVETSAFHGITVRATSSDGSTTDANFTITVSDVDESDVSAISDMDGAANSVSENAVNGTVVGVTAAATDADSTDSVSYSLTNDAGGRFTIDSISGVVTVADGSLLDVETSAFHGITVRATSTDGSTSDANFTISLSDVDESDVSAVSDSDGATNSVPENAVDGATVGITATATDADSTDSVSYSLTDDADGRFEIDSLSGVVSVADGILLDREAASSHEITIRAISTDGSFADETFFVNLIDVDEFDVNIPIDVNSSPNSVAENAANGTVVGITVTANDDDTTNNMISYSLDDDAGGRFAIDAVTGIVTVADGTRLDHETNTSHDITVRVLSTDSSTTTEVFAVNVIDQNDNAPQISAGQRFSIHESMSNGTRVGVVAASDADTLGSIQNWSIIGGDSDGIFAIDSLSGEITIADSSNLDYEANDLFTLTLTVGDGPNASSPEAVVVSVINVNESPIHSAPTSVSVIEDTASPIDGISISDPDGDNPMMSTRLQVNRGVLNVSLVGSASISAGDNGSSVLTILGALADINATLASLQYTGELNFAGDHADTLMMTTNDGGSTGSGGPLHTVDMIQIEILPVNDAPVVSAPTEALHAVEQTSLNIEGTGFRVSDVDDANGVSTATLVVGEGTITVTPGNSGVVVSAGNGTNTVTLVGSISEINDLLTGGSSESIEYLNPSDSPSLSTFLTVTVNDQGNSGADPGLTGDATSEEGSNTVLITLAATNDTPDNVGSVPEQVVVTEDVVSPIDLSLLDIVDADQNGGSYILNIASRGEGQLFANRADGVEVGGNGTASLSLNGSLIDLNSYLNGPSNIQYAQTTEHLNGDAVDTLTITIREDELAPLEVNVVTLGAIRVDIAAVNDLPLANSDSYSLRAGETLHVFSPGVTENDADVETASLTVTRVGGPSVGDLMLHPDGSFSFTAPVAFFGEVTFSYRTSDGTDWSDVATVTIDVAAAGTLPGNDAEDPTADQPEVDDPGEDADESHEIEDTKTERENEDVEVQNENNRVAKSSSGIANGTSTSDDSGRVQPISHAVPSEIPIAVLRQGGTEDSFNFNQNNLRVDRSIASKLEGTILLDLHSHSSESALGSHAAILSREFLWSRLDTVSEVVDREYTTSDFVVGSGMVISSTVIASYVIWTMRAGYTLAYFSSAIPVWSHLDPLPILNSVANGNLGDNESLVDIIGR